MNMKKINVVLCGMRFGAAFVPIYRDHPDVESVGICDTNPEVLKRVAEAHGISRMYSSLEDVLKDDSVDAVHLVTPIPLHEEQAVKVLQSGRHCACTVPMAITLEGLRRITQAQRASGKNYMMMETTLYTRQFMMIREMLEKGELGRIC
jgi:predicted dehydrogenase